MSDISLAEEFMQEHLFAADVALDSSNNVITSQWSGSGADADVSGNESGDAVMEQRVLSPSNQNFVNLRITVSNSDVGLASASPPGVAPLEEEEEEASTTVVLVNADATVEVVSGVVIPVADDPVDDHPDTLVVSVAPDESLDDPQPVADPRGAFPKASAATTSDRQRHHPPPTPASTSRPAADPRGAVPKPVVVPQHRPSPPTSTPMRSRTSSVSSVSSTASSWSMLSMNESEQHDRWASEWAYADALKFPPPPNPDDYHRMTEEEAEAEVEKWEKKNPIPPLPLFFERAVGKAGFKIRSQAINDVYKGWQVNRNTVKRRN